ncbi:ribonuclease P protein component [bacterium DOLZORAL124_64_63]|nr:MAG: ribonuclease P protein component [bacterium DOLZORAL124_64_63]
MSWRSLSRKTEFQRVYGNGTKIVGRYVVVYLLPAKDFGSAVVASRKIGGAVQRNRAKRLLREARRQGSLGNVTGIQGIFERFFPSIEPLNGSREEGKSGLWVVLLARHRILRARTPEVREELDNLLKNIS